MDDSIAGGWMAAPVPGIDILVSLRELNRRFLDLAATAGRDVPPGRIATLSGDQRAAVAMCPYALFDMRFGDERYWSQRLQCQDTWHVADAPPVEADMIEFAGLVLFYSWHVAVTAPLRAQLLLGMPRTVVAAFAHQTLDRLPAIAATEARHLSVRWHTCDAYWSALVEAAVRAEPGALRRAQLRGIQYAAAARLAATPIAATGR